MAAQAASLFSDNDGHQRERHAIRCMPWLCEGYRLYSQIAAGTTQRLQQRRYLPSGSVLLLFGCRKHIHGPMDNCNNVNLVLFYVVDNAVGAFNNFSDWVNVVFRNSSAGEGELRDLLRSMG